MELSAELRCKIADQIIQIAVPVLFWGMVVNCTGIIFLGGQQYQRLVPAILIVFLLIPAWFFKRNEKQLVGIYLS